VRFSLLRSVASSAQCAPDLGCYGWWNDHGNDRTAQHHAEDLRSTFRSRIERWLLNDPPQPPELVAVGQLLGAPARVSPPALTHRAAAAG
jgi:hypothetical protein